MQLIRSLAHYTTLAAQIVSELCTTYPVSVNDFQGDREGRPYNRRLRVTQAIWYCRGDPRGRPGSPIVFLAIIHRPWHEILHRRNARPKKRYNREWKERCCIERK